MNKELLSALRDINLTRAAELLAAGADINSRTEIDESFLNDIIHIEDVAERHTVVRFMLAHGADPRLISPDGGGPLFAAVIAADTVVLRLLLDHGADPNQEHDGGETLYEYAEFDYLYEIFDLHPPEKPTAADKATPETWLLFLDRIAVQYGYRRPDYLFLLRERGALTSAEQQK